MYDDEEDIVMFCNTYSLSKRRKKNSDQILFKLFYYVCTFKHSKVTLIVSQKERTAGVFLKKRLKRETRKKEHVLNPPSYL